VSIHQAIDRFLGDARIRLLRDRWRETRPLQICYPSEVPLTRMLAWLMDPTEGHALGDGPIRALLLQAWRQLDEEEAGVSPELRKFLSPSHIEAQSFEDCLVDCEVTIGDGKLDLLILEPRRRWLIAIENKFGAAEGDKQLERYRKALQKLYPDWNRILVFLDYYDQPPRDEGWLAMSYEWLCTVLKTAEGSLWLSDGSREVLSAFRSALDFEADPFEQVCEEKTLIDVVHEHRTVFELMRQWHSAKRGLGTLVDDVFWASGSLDDKATQQLFKVYWQKSELWGACIPMLAYAGLLRAAREVFADVELDRHGKGVYFSRTPWGKLAASADSYWPITTCVYPEPPHRAGEKNLFRVISYVRPAGLRSELLVDPVIQKIQNFRRRSMRPLVFDPASDDYSLAVSRDITESDVAATLVRHLKSVEGLFQEVQALAMA